jgi:hypothetical protein
MARLGEEGRRVNGPDYGQRGWARRAPTSGEIGKARAEPPGNPRAAGRIAFAADGALGRCSVEFAKDGLELGPAGLDAARLCLAPGAFFPGLLQPAQTDRGVVRLDGDGGLVEEAHRVLPRGLGGEDVSKGEGRDDVVRPGLEHLAQERLRRLVVLGAIEVGVSRAERRLEGQIRLGEGEPGAGGERRQEGEAGVAEADGRRKVALEEQDVRQDAVREERRGRGVDAVLQGAWRQRSGRLNEKGKTRSRT